MRFCISRDLVSYKRRARIPSDDSGAFTGSTRSSSEEKTTPPSRPSPAVLCLKFSELLLTGSHPGPYSAPSCFSDTCPQGGPLGSLDQSYLLLPRVLGVCVGPSFEDFASSGSHPDASRPSLRMLTAHHAPKGLGFFVTSYEATRSRHRVAYLTELTVECCRFQWRLRQSSCDHHWCSAIKGMKAFSIPPISERTRRLASFFASLCSAPCAP